MSVMDMIRQQIKPDAVLLTPSGRSKFKVQSHSSQDVRLRVGKDYRWPIGIPCQCWEGIPQFLRGNGWVLIGATRGRPWHPNQDLPTDC